MSKIIQSIPSWFAVWTLFGLVLVTVAIVVFTTLPKTPSKKPEGQIASGVSRNRPVAAQQGNGLDDPFFVYDPTVQGFDLDNGDQSFGTQDKVGVAAQVMSLYSNETDDFFAIGSDNPARVQYLSTIGYPVLNPQSTWIVDIGLAADVNGQVRVKVFAIVGTDVACLGGHEMQIDGAQLQELWSLDLTGANPTLLDRTTVGFDGLLTHTESPRTIFNAPVGIPFGPGGPEMGDEVNP